MSDKNNSVKRKNKALKELKIFIFIILLGLSFIVFNQDVGSRKFPMGLTQEWIEKARFLGWLILIGGYHTSLLIRLLSFLIKKLKRNRQ